MGSNLSEAILVLVKISNLKVVQWYLSWKIFQFIQIFDLNKCSKLLILSELLFWPETHKCNFLIVQDTLAYRVAYKAALLTKDKLQFA